MTVSTFHEAMFDWISLITGYASSNVIRGNQNGPRPSGNFATYQVTTVQLADFGGTEQGDPDVNGKFEYTHTTRNIVSVDVNIYDLEGWQILQKLDKSNMLLDVRGIFAPLGIVLIGSDAVQDLTQLGDTEWRPRYQAEFRFRTYYEFTEENYIINDYSLEGKVDDDSVTAEGSI